MLLGHRYYDPSAGRFVSQDPLRHGSNWYSYCGNNPGARTDPTGLHYILLGIGGDIIAPFGGVFPFSPGLGMIGHINITIGDGGIGIGGAIITGPGLGCGMAGGPYIGISDGTVETGIHSGIGAGGFIDDGEFGGGINYIGGLNDIAIGGGFGGPGIGAGVTLGPAIEGQIHLITVQNPFPSVIHMTDGTGPGKWVQPIVNFIDDPIGTIGGLFK